MPSGKLQIISRIAFETPAARLALISEQVFHDPFTKWKQRRAELMTPRNSADGTACMEAVTTTQMTVNPVSAYGLRALAFPEVKLGV
jgi:hypothetical protein